MCGLAGFCGKNPNFTKLKFLGVLNQSRGKDSSGLAIDFQGISKVAGDRGKGSFEEFCRTHVFNEELVEKAKRILIHTRKATQGAINEENAHPFEYETDKGRAIFMHNGNITNIDELKEQFSLKETSPVDSKVLGEAIVNKKYKILTEYEGAAALAWMLEEDENSIYLWNGGSKTAGDTMYCERGIYYTIEENNGENAFYFSSEEDHLKVVFGSDADIIQVPVNTLIKVTDGKISYKKTYSRDEFVFSLVGLGSSSKKVNVKTYPQTTYKNYYGFGGWGDEDDYVFPKTTAQAFIPPFKFSPVNTGSIYAKSLINGVFGFNELGNNNFKFPERTLVFDGFRYRVFEKNMGSSLPASGTLYFYDETGVISSEQEYNSYLKKESPNKSEVIVKSTFFKGFRLQDDVSISTFKNELNKVITCDGQELPYFNYVSGVLISMLHPESVIIQIYNNTLAPLNIPKENFDRSFVAKALKSFYEDFGKPAYFLFDVKYCPFQYLIDYCNKSNLLYIKGAVPKESYKPYYTAQIYKTDLDTSTGLTSIDPFIISYYYGKLESDLASLSEMANNNQVQDFVEISEEDVEETKDFNSFSYEESKIFDRDVLCMQSAIEDSIESFKEFMQTFYESTENTGRGASFLTALEEKLHQLEKFEEGLSKLITNYENKYLDIQFVQDYIEVEEDDSDLFENEDDGDDDSENGFGLGIHGIHDLLTI